eukprot:c22937_g1_i1.p1 GENE.c22937_g1_i1~~c22937_g1_i1.p1  ORF type:complete len:343 (-),score=124.12 c22937_g1_i1:147-1151(-)
MARSSLFVAALLFFVMDTSFFGTAHAMSMGQTLQAALPMLQAGESLKSNFGGMKVNLPEEAQEFINKVRSKIEEDPSILKKPASWDTILSFVELASSRGKQAHKHSEEYAKKTPVQKVVHHLFEEEGKSKKDDDNDDDDDDNSADLTKNVTDQVDKVVPGSSSSPMKMVIFFIICLVLIGGLRYLALFLTQKNQNVDALDYMIGTNFTTASMIAGLVGGFSFSFVDSFVLFWTMVLFEGMLSKLPGASEEGAFAAYANVFSNLISGAIGTSATQSVTAAMGGDSSTRVPFWSQLLGALLGGVIGLMIAKIIPHKQRLRGSVQGNDSQDNDDADN